MRLLFVCLGNICRSPLAEGIFIEIAERRGMRDRFTIDSAGTGGWHAGSAPDPRSLAVARSHGTSLPSVARQVTSSEVNDWDLVLAMDRSNSDTLHSLGFPPDRIRLIRSFDAGSTDLDVPDPYYGGPEGFEDVYSMLVAACEGLLDHLAAEA